MVIKQPQISAEPEDIYMHSEYSVLKKKPGTGNKQKSGKLVHELLMILIIQFPYYLSNSRYRKLYIYRKTNKNDENPGSPEIEKNLEARADLRSKENIR